MEGSSAKTRAHGGGGQEAASSTVPAVTTTTREPPPPAPTPYGVAPPPMGEVGTVSKAGFAQELDAVEAGLLSAKADGDIGAVDQESLEELQLQAARKLRQLLSSNRELLIKEVLDRNWVPLLLGWLHLNQKPAVQVEALWALTNIAAGTAEHTHVLLKHGAVPTLVGLLRSPSQEVLEQAMWVLGNLAGEGATTRDAVLASGALAPLSECLQRPKCSLSMLRIGSWTLSNLCDGQPRPSIDIHSVLGTLANLLRQNDAEVLSHTCWALSHLCDGPSTHIKAVVDEDVCWRLVQLLMHRSWRVTKPALRTIGNIVCAEDETDYTQHIIEAGAVPCLRQLIAHTNREIQKEACWTLSNIAAGTPDQIQTVLDSGAVPSLVKLASSKETDPEVKNEACWVVLNATSCGSEPQIEYLVKQGCVAVLGELLSENSMIMMALDGLERILQVGDDEAKRDRGGGINPYASLLSTSRIEQLESHKSSAVAKRASRIWKQHFVTCAICSSSYSKHSQEARFCNECKCHVCLNCNCTVFHLSYQEELWKDMTTKEASKKQQAAESKRAKKQKKKKKTKDKKQSTPPPTSTSTASTSTTASKKEKSASEDSIDPTTGSEEDVVGGDVHLPSNGAADADMGKPADKCPGASLGGGASPTTHQDAQPPQEQSKRGRRSKAGASAGASVVAPDNGRARTLEGLKAKNTATPANTSAASSPTATNGSAESTPAGSPAHGPKKEEGKGSRKDDEGDDGETQQPPSTSTSQEKSPGTATENDDLVTFLQETGSILALADLLDKADDDFEDVARSEAIEV